MGTKIHNLIIYPILENCKFWGVTQTIDKLKVDMWMIVRSTVTTKALIPVDRLPIWNRYEGGPIFTIVDQKNKDNLLRTTCN